MSETVKNLPVMQETWVQYLGWEDPLEKGMATTPVFLPGESMDRGAWWAAVHGVEKVGHVNFTLKERLGER